MFMGLAGRRARAAARADLQLRPSSRMRSAPATDTSRSRPPDLDRRFGESRRAGHRARAPAVHDPRRGLAPVLRARPGRLPNRADRTRLGGSGRPTRGNLTTMVETSKIAYLLERLAQGVAAHDRENPDHHTWGIGMAHFDIERLGLEEGEQILPGHRAAGRRRGDRRSSGSCATAMHDEGAAEQEEEVVDAIASEEIAEPVHAPALERRTASAAPVASAARSRDRERDRPRRRCCAILRAQPRDRRALDPVVERRRAARRPRSRRARARGRRRCRAASTSRAPRARRRARRAAPPGSICAPSALATAAASSMQPISAARHSGSVRMKPIGRSLALVVHASAFRRTSFDHRICASLGPSSAGIPARSQRLRQRARAPLQAPDRRRQIDPQERARLDDPARRGAIRLDPDRPGRDPPVAEPLAQHRACGRGR